MFAPQDNKNPVALPLPDFSSQDSISELGLLAAAVKSGHTDKAGAEQGQRQRLRNIGLCEVGFDIQAAGIMFRIAPAGIVVAAQIGAAISHIVQIADGPARQGKAQIREVIQGRGADHVARRIGRVHDRQVEQFAVTRAANGRGESNRQIVIDTETVQVALAAGRGVEPGQLGDFDVGRVVDDVQRQINGRQRAFFVGRRT